MSADPTRDIVHCERAYAFDSADFLLDEPMKRSEIGCI
jgi:hypothetical protein